jgi:hypothetical protein
MLMQQDAVHRDAVDAQGNRRDGGWRAGCDSDEEHCRRQEHSPREQKKHKHLQKVQRIKKYND